MIPDVDILFLTYNRLNYTKQALNQLISAKSTVNFRVFILDNSSTDGTKEYLKTFASQNVSILFSPINLGNAKSMNFFWQRISTAPLLAKVDNDTLVPDYWIDHLVNTYHDIKQHIKVGVIGGIHFCTQDLEKDFQWTQIGNSLIDVRNFVDGTSVLWSRELFQAIGPLPEPPLTCKFNYLAGWDVYQRMLKQKGYINGYVYPLKVALLDDPNRPDSILDSEYIFNVRGWTLEEFKRNNQHG